jgi:hypothetical protein
VYHGMGHHVRIGPTIYSLCSFEHIGDPSYHMVYHVCKRITGWHARTQIGTSIHGSCHRMTILRWLIPWSAGAHQGDGPGDHIPGSPKHRNLLITVLGQSSGRRLWAFLCSGSPRWLIRVINHKQHKQPNVAKWGSQGPTMATHRDQVLLTTR